MTKTKIYIASASVLVILITGSYIASNLRTSRLEKAAADAVQKSKESEAAAQANEIKAAEYRQKLEYIESRLIEMTAIARRQDEQLEKNTIDTAAARGRVQRARSAGTKPTSAAELCAKLGELGHSCAE